MVKQIRGGGGGDGRRRKVGVSEKHKSITAGKERVTLTECGKSERGRQRED